MSENGKPEAPIVMAITFDPSNGNISVNGPIHDKILSFGLLELAKEAITETSRRNAASSITLPPPNRPTLMKS